MFRMPREAYALSRRYRRDVSGKRRVCRRVESTSVYELLNIDYRMLQFYTEFRTMAGG